MPRYQSSEEWQRTKSYLLRGLFEDLPLLSPLQEEQKSELSSISGDLQPDSHLPDLIIEIEPKKPNLCDETPEFYEKLLKEFRRLYKTDHYSPSNSPVSLDSLKNAEENEENFKILTELSSSDNYSPHLLQELENTGDNTLYNTIELKQKERPRKRQRENIIEASSEGNFHSHKKIRSEQILIPYDKNISVEYANEDTSQRYSRTVTPVEGCNKSVRKHDENIRHESDFDIGGDEETEEEEGQKKGEEGEDEEVLRKKYEGFAISCGANRVMNNSETFRPFSPEIMRRAHHSASIGSLHEMSTSDPDGTSDKLIDIQPVEMEEVIISYGPKKRAMSLNTFSSPSPPKLARKSKMVSRIYTSSRRSSSYSSSSHSYKFAGVQTSFSDDGSGRTPFWNQLFVGTPSIYNLCSCKNHVCS